MSPNTLYAVVSVISAALALGVALYLHWNRTPTGRPYFTLMMAGIAVWSIGAAFDGVSSTVAEKVFWSKISYFGVLAIPPAWFLFSLTSFRAVRPLRRFPVWSIWIVPVLMLGFVMTNEMHGFVWPSIGPDPSGSTSAILYGHGPAFWGSLGYAYALFLAGTIVFLRNAWRAQPHQRRQALVMAVAALIPWLWSVAYAAGWSPIPGLDFTPIGFALSGLLIAVDIGRFGFLDVVPAAFEMLFETFRDSALVLDGEGKIVRMNDSAELLLGLTDAQNGRHWSEAFARYPDLAAFIGKHEGPGETIAGEMTLGGRVLDVRLLRIANEQHRLLGRVLMLRDVTLRRRAEDEIRSSLEAKENLLKEVHHRVKNNMQVISSLLSLQSEAINDPGVRTLYRESENRVRSMILVHDRLSRAESHAELDFGAYLRTLVNDLVASSSRQKVDVHFALEPVVVPARIAASCGLIVNEIVSNALKHAFVGRDSGKVTVTLAAPATGTVRLTIADDGVGLPRDTGDLGGRTLGMTIIENLVHQIKGSLAIRVEKGTTFAIEFPCG